MTRVESAKLVAMLQAAWPRGVWPPETVQIYGANLCELPADAALAAIKRIITTSTFQPTIGEIFDESNRLSAEFAEAYDRYAGELMRGKPANEKDERILANKRARLDAVAKELGRVIDANGLLPAPKQPAMNNDARLAMRNLTVGIGFGGKGADR